MGYKNRRSNKSSQESIQAHLLDLIKIVELWIIDAIDDETTGLEHWRAEEITALVISNLLVNLINAAPSSSVISDRYAVIKQTIKSIESISLQMWSIHEASQADDAVKN